MFEFHKNKANTYCIHVIIDTLHTNILFAAILLTLHMCVSGFDELPKGQRIYMLLACKGKQKQKQILYLDYFSSVQLYSCLTHSHINHTHSASSVHSFLFSEVCLHHKSDQNWKQGRSESETMQQGRQISYNCQS